MSTQRHHEHMLEAIPESTEEAMASQANKNRKRKKGESGKGNSRKNRNLEIIPEEAESSPFEKEFEREHQEAFDAISVAKKHENNPQLANGFTNFSLSPQPSTSHC